jgi:transposase
MLKRSVEIKRTIILTGRTDLRRGIDGLVSLVRLSYNLDPLDKGTLFLFCGAKKDRIKGSLYEGDGWLMVCKRLTFGRYMRPSKPEEAKSLTWEEYDRLMNGFTVQSSIKENWKPARE